MRQSTLILSLSLLVAVCYTVIGNRSQEQSPNPASERRELRESRRATRQAEMEHEIDSLMVAKAFIFRPNTIVREPTGSMQMLSNPNFEIRVWDGAADIFMPYISGNIPPFRHSLLNYTITRLDNYTATRSDNGWSVSFNSNLFSASKYTFLFEVNSKFGTTVLTLENSFNNDVRYSGLISKIY